MVSETMINFLMICLGWGSGFLFRDALELIKRRRGGKDDTDRTIKR